MIDFLFLRAKAMFSHTFDRSDRLMLEGTGDNLDYNLEIIDFIPFSIDKRNCKQSFLFL